MEIQAHVGFPPFGGTYPEDHEKVCAIPRDAQLNEGGPARVQSAKGACNEEIDAYSPRLARHFY